MKNINPGQLPSHLRPEDLDWGRAERLIDNNGDTFEEFDLQSDKFQMAVIDERNRSLGVNVNHPAYSWGLFIYGRPAEFLNVYQDKKSKQFYVLIPQKNGFAFKLGVQRQEDHIYIPSGSQATPIEWPAEIPVPQKSIKEDLEF